MTTEKLLMTPGPTMLPPSVLEVMRRQIIHHRTKDFEQTLDALQQGLKHVYGTKQVVITLASSGSGAMEACVSNLFSVNDKVLAVSIGNFGDRFAKIAQCFGLDVIRLDYEWGKAAVKEDIKAILDKEKDIKGILITHNETSTGVSNDIKAISELTRDTDILLCVDAISALGGLEMRFDEWGIDCVVAGSQKALMAPPGLGFIALSEKAWNAVKSSNIPKFYFDLKKYKAGIEGLGANPPYTPAITTMMAQAEALKLIMEEGLENIYERHRRLALATQKGVKALGLELLPDEKDSSYIITAVRAPEGINIKNVINRMNNEFDIMITGGQGKLKGNIFRIGHCGYCSGTDIIKTFSALEICLEKEGYKFESGMAVKAIQNELRGERI
ncbi:MAG TPA: alanine--glyoxylate aminotransferase family protein [Clostridia bacterium]|nr:alanine--glyoxylate aminotransferase family protein [Clostridia bacterium]